MSPSPSTPPDRRGPLAAGRRRPSRGLLAALLVSAVLTAAAAPAAGASEPDQGGGGPRARPRRPSPPRRAPPSRAGLRRQRSRRSRRRSRPSPTVTPEPPPVAPTPAPAVPRSTPAPPWFQASSAQAAAGSPSRPSPSSPVPMRCPGTRARSAATPSRSRVPSACAVCCARTTARRTRAASPGPARSAGAATTRRAGPTTGPSTRTTRRTAPSRTSSWPGPSALTARGSRPATRPGSACSTSSGTARSGSLEQQLEAVHRPSPHTDHIHLSLSWDGAFARTSWWTGSAVTRVDHGPCQVYEGVLVAPYAGPNYRRAPRRRPRLAAHRSPGPRVPRLRQRVVSAAGPATGTPPDPCRCTPMSTARSPACSPPTGPRVDVGDRGSRSRSRCLPDPTRSACTRSNVGPGGSNPTLGCPTVQR
jgi:hypothetical protein